MYKAYATKYFCETVPHLVNVLKGVSLTLLGSRHIECRDSLLESIWPQLSSIFFLPGSLHRCLFSRLHCHIWDASSSFLGDYLRHLLGYGCSTEPINHLNHDMMVNAELATYNDGCPILLRLLHVYNFQRR